METSTSEIQKIVKSGGQQGNLMTALVEARKRNENQKNLKIMQASMKDDPRTIAQQFEEENNQATANEVARGVAGALAQKKKRADANMRKVMNRGLAAAPVRKPMIAAQGGIVGYANGNMVRDPRDMPPEEELSYADRLKLGREKSRQNLRKRIGSFFYPAGKSGLAGKGEEAGQAAFKESLAPKNMPMPPQALPPTAMTAPEQGLAGLPIPPQAMPKTEITPVQATTKIEEVPKGDIAAAPKQEVKTETDPFKTKEYQDWFDVFIQTLGAKDGQYAKAYIEAKTKLSDRDNAAAQQVIDNENTKADLDIKRLTAENTKMYQEQIVAGRALASLQDDLQKLITESLKLEERLGVQYDLPILQSKLQEEKDKGEKFLFGTSAEKVKKIQEDIDAAKEAMQLEIKSTKSGRDLLSSILGIQNAIRSFETTLGIPSINPAPAPAIQDGFGELKIR